MGSDTLLTRVIDLWGSDKTKEKGFGLPGSRQKGDYVGEVMEGTVLVRPGSADPAQEEEVSLHKE